MSFRNIATCSLFIILLGKVSAQKVVVKEFTKTYKINRELLLEIDAEKSNIYIETWDENQVWLNFKMLSKNNDEKQASKDIESIHYTELKSRERLFFRSYLRIENTSGLKSLLTSEFHIKIPANCHVKIKNTLGDTFLKNVNTTLTYEATYGKLTTTNCSGMANLFLKIGEWQNDNSSFEKCTAELTSCKTRFKDSRGNYVMKLRFGSLYLMLPSEGFTIDSDTDNTEITLVNRFGAPYHYDIVSKSGTIDIPVSVTGTAKVKKSMEGETLKFFSKPNHSVGAIILRNQYSDITAY